MEEGMLNVYGYIRVSTSGQVKEGFSLEEQEGEIQKYCKDKGYHLLQVFRDEGVSGAKANEDEMSIEREGLLDLLAALKENEVQYVVVLSTSRLWRSDMVKVLIHREFKRHGVDVKAIDRENYSIYTQNPNEVFVNGMFELLDVYERLEIALKLKRGRVQKAKNGGYAGGGIPFGYFCKRGQKQLMIQPEEARAVQRIYELKQQKPEMTLKMLAEHMNMEGYKGRKGTAFYPMLIKRILEKEDFYKGKTYSYSGIESKGTQPPIL